MKRVKAPFVKAPMDDLTTVSSQKEPVEGDLKMLKDLIL